MNKIDTGQMPGRITWLEDEQRQTRVSLTKLEQQVEQMWNLQRDRTLWQDEMERSLIALRGQLAKTVGLDDSTRQLRDQLAGLQEDYANHTQANEKSERLFQTESDRIRQTLAEHWHRMELLQKLIEDLTGRLGPLADSVRRQVEAQSEMAQTVEELRNQTEALGTRQQLLGEQVRRCEQEVGRLDRELEPLRKQDEVALVKVQIVADQARRIEEQVASMASREHILQEVSEKLQVHTLEQQRTHTTLSEFEADLEDHARHLEEHLRLIKQLEERRVLLVEQMAQLQGQIAEYRSEAEGQLAEHQQMVEQQKERESAELQRQIKESKEQLVRLRGKVS